MLRWHIKHWKQCVDTHFLFILPQPVHQSGGLFLESLTSVFVLVVIPFFPNYRTTEIATDIGTDAVWKLAPEMVLDEKICLVLPWVVNDHRECKGTKSWIAVVRETLGIFRERRNWCGTFKNAKLTQFEDGFKSNFIFNIFPSLLFVLIDTLCLFLITGWLRSVSNCKADTSVKAQI